MEYSYYNRRSFTTHHKSPPSTQTFSIGKSFTVLELVVVIVISLILLTAATLVANNIIRKERVEGETARIVSLLKEAQQKSMIESYYKDDPNKPIRKRHFGVRFFLSDNSVISINERDPEVALVKKDVNQSIDKFIIVERPQSAIYTLKGIKLSLKTSGDKPIDPNCIDGNYIYVYFNDMGSTICNGTIIVSDKGEKYRRDIVISQMGNINVEADKR